MSRAKNPCAMCSHFDHAKYPKEAAQGWGRCDAHDQAGKPILFVQASCAPCKLFGAGDNVAARQSFLKKHREAA